MTRRKDPAKFPTLPLSDRRTQSMHAHVNCLLVTHLTTRISKQTHHQRLKNGKSFVFKLRCRFLGFANKFLVFC